MTRIGSANNPIVGVTALRRLHTRYVDLFLRTKEGRHVLYMTCLSLELVRVSGSRAEQLLRLQPSPSSDRQVIEHDALHL